MQIHVEDGQLDAVDRQLLPVADIVIDGVQSRLGVALPRLVFLVEALGGVASSMRTVVDVIEGVGGPGGDILRPVDLQPGVLESDVELVILQPPAPVLVGHSVHRREVLVLEQQNPADERRLKFNFKI